MPAQRRRDPRGRPPHVAPRALPNDLYAYNDDPAPSTGLRRNPSPDAFDIEKLPVIDDWPERVPVTVSEVDIFERYFGDVLDRLFGPIDTPETDLNLLSQSDNKSHE
ncbi:hypothetical protein [Rhodomicrobium lacus]|uniref:hypothetical protein n=1 Tax=Rhodomicrobium lacus TaxID=2498452 RepID=UPI0026E16FE3|nr:hypothetical protein [Rhodomicrobium lacus]WKW52035.1 hypothetical protein QMO75_06020 [Rhodomicrobium lacus]